MYLWAVQSFRVIASLRSTLSLAQATLVWKFSGVQYGYMTYIAVRHISGQICQTIPSLKNAPHINPNLTWCFREQVTVWICPRCFQEASSVGKSGQRNRQGSRFSSKIQLEMHATYSFQGCGGAPGTIRRNPRSSFCSLLTKIGRFFDIFDLCGLNIINWYIINVVLLHCWFYSAVIHIDHPTRFTPGAEMLPNVRGKCGGSQASPPGPGTFDSLAPIDRSCLIHLGAPTHLMTQTIEKIVLL